MTNDQNAKRSAKVITEGDDRQKFDLEERTSLFAEQVLKFAKKFPQLLLIIRS